jgi:L-seryl-tRNA(Ser) seleniumtransferase
VGGGSLPGETLPSAGLALAAGSAEGLVERLRAGDPIVIGRIEKDRLILDLRTVAPEDDEALAGAVRAALAPRP